MESVRKKLIVGNWKMYKTVKEAVAYVNELLPLLQEVENPPYLAVPFTTIHPVVHASHAKIIVGAQNMNDASEGAFTGEIAAKMIAELGARFVILGHSERRRFFKEDNAFINRKVKRALADGLQPFLCIGETEEEREAGKTTEVLKTQLLECLEGVDAEQIPKVVISYEPVWAIGTLNPATVAQAEEAHQLCRQCIKEKYHEEAANSISILYGGSVTPQNISEFLAESDIDGVLVGGASLNPQIFAQIIHYQKVTT